MKRLDLLKAAPVAALVACGGGASQLVTPASGFCALTPRAAPAAARAVNYYQDRDHGIAGMRRRPVGERNGLYRTEGRRHQRMRNGMV